MMDPGPGMDVCRATFGGVIGLDRSRSDYRRRASFTSLADPSFRSNATQLRVSYQYAGHVTSRCHLVGRARCTSCHDPHSGTARDSLGRDSGGVHAHRMCTGCHGHLTRSQASFEHHGDNRDLHCIDCHMSPSSSCGERSPQSPHNSSPAQALCALRPRQATPRAAVHKGSRPGSTPARSRGLRVRRPAMPAAKAPDERRDCEASPVLDLGRARARSACETRATGLKAMPMQRPRCPSCAAPLDNESSRADASYCPDCRVPLSVDTELADHLGDDRNATLLTERSPRGMRWPIEQLVALALGGGAVIAALTFWRAGWGPFHPTTIVATIGLPALLLNVLGARWAASAIAGIVGKAYVLKPIVRPISDGIDVYPLSSDAALAFMISGAILLALATWLAMSGAGERRPRRLGWFHVISFSVGVAAVSYRLNAESDRRVLARYADKYQQLRADLAEVRSQMLAAKDEISVEATAIDPPLRWHPDGEQGNTELLSLAAIEDRPVTEFELDFHAGRHLHKSLHWTAAGYALGAHADWPADEQRERSLARGLEIQHLIVYDAPKRSGVLRWWLIDLDRQQLVIARRLQVSGGWHAAKTALFEDLKARTGGDFR